jgi:fatty acid-binding protein DegV
MDKLESFLLEDSAPWIMLEYSDNFAWVKDSVKKQIENTAPLSEILLKPLSLTSGAHTGPGTWAMAFLPGKLKK